jgi:hypothetical protein
MKIFNYLPPIQIAEGFLPVDLTTAANDGDWVRLSARYPHCQVTFFKEPGAAADNCTLTLEQATSAAGAGAKALNFTRAFHKTAATNLQGTADYTMVDQAAANTFTVANNGDKAAIWAVPINLEMLDRAGGFAFIRGRVADAGATAGQFGCLFYIFLGVPMSLHRATAHSSVLA